MMILACQLKKIIIKKYNLRNELAKFFRRNTGRS